MSNPLWPGRAGIHVINETGEPIDIAYVRASGVPLLWQVESRAHGETGERRIPGGRGASAATTLLAPGETSFEIAARFHESGESLVANFVLRIGGDSYCTSVVRITVRGATASECEPIAPLVRGEPRF